MGKLSDKGSKCYAEVKCQDTITDMALLTQCMTKFWKNVDINKLELSKELRNGIKKNIRKVENDFTELKHLFKF